MRWTLGGVGRTARPTAAAAATIFQKALMMMKHLFGLIESCLFRGHVGPCPAFGASGQWFPRQTGSWGRVQGLTFRIGARKTEIPVRMKTMVPVTLCSLAEKSTWSGRLGDAP